MRNVRVAAIILSVIFISGIISAQAVTEKKELWPNGKIKLRSWQLDSGIVIERVEFREDGSPLKMEKFDKDNHKILECRYDGLGKLDDSLDGWAAKRWEYFKGKLQEESIYDEDGKIKERKIFNEQGDLVKKQYVDDDTINPDEEFNPYQVGNVKEEYFDKYGKKEGTTAVEDVREVLTPYGWMEETE